MNTFDFSKLNLGVDGDSITAGNQWSYHVVNDLGFAGQHNVAVGSSVWYKRKYTANGVTVETQDYSDPDFAGISDGWEPTEDMNEMQKRMNNCAVVHIQKFISEVKSGEYPVPDVFVFAMGTNDEEQCIGDAEAALEGKEASLDKAYDEANAMRWCIQTIMTEYPDARVFVCTPIQTGNPEHNAKIERQIITMKKICGAFAVQMIDCFHNSGICEKFEVNGGEGRYLRDGLHPAEKGQCLEGKYIGKEIRNNMF